MSDRDTAPWDSFWQSGQSACCADAEDDVYAGAFRTPWISFFDGLGESASILDLCTGNGAILLIALERSASFDLHGVDSADIDPPKSNPDRFVELSRMQFHANTSVDALPFEDCSFDAVTSQFGIEYTPLEAAAVEAVRVLKPGGRGQFVLHATDGMTVEHAVLELADIDELLDDSDIFSAAASALESVHRAEEAADEATLSHARDAYGDFHARLTQLGDTWRDRAAAAVFKSTGSILQHTYANRRHFTMETVLDKVSETREAVEQHRVRLRLLTDSAMNLEQCQSLCRSFLENGCSSADTSAIHEGAGPRMLGWRVVIRK